MEEIIVILSVIGIGVAKAVSDKLENTWEKARSANNKWKTPLELSKSDKWYYLWIYTPKYTEAFPYSSTILVMLTDRWHFWNAIRHTCQSIAISTFT